MFGKTLGGALLVAGTCIGAGMLSLPVATSAAGLVPTVGAFLLCWIIMTLTALYMLEVSLCFPEETNLISMAHSTLGKGGELIAWLSYVFFLYAVMTAYTAGGSEILSNYLGFLNLSDKNITILLCGIFAFIVFLGTLFVDWMNRLLVMGLILCYLGLYLAVWGMST
jgi:tyrosine-specific transport protein